MRWNLLLFKVHPFIWSVLQSDGKKKKKKTASSIRKCLLNDCHVALSFPVIKHKEPSILSSFFLLQDGLKNQSYREVFCGQSVGHLPFSFQISPWSFLPKKVLQSVSLCWFNVCLWCYTILCTIIKPVRTLCIDWQISDV